MKAVLRRRALSPDQGHGPGAGPVRDPLEAPHRGGQPEQRPGACDLLGYEKGLSGDVAAFSGASALPSTTWAHHRQTKDLRESLTDVLDSVDTIRDRARRVPKLQSALTDLKSSHRLPQHHPQRQHRLPGELPLRAEDRREAGGQRRQETLDGLARRRPALHRRQSQPRPAR